MLAANYKTTWCQKQKQHEHNKECWKSELYDTNPIKFTAYRSLSCKVADSVIKSVTGGKNEKITKQTSSQWHMYIFFNKRISPWTDQILNT
jgi:hypothetical protein